jgi:hypothetical protein
MFDRFSQKQDHIRQWSISGWRRTTILGVLCIGLALGTGGCRLFSWISKEDAPPTKPSDSLPSTTEAKPAARTDETEKQSEKVIEPALPKQGSDDSRPRDLPPGETVNEDQGESERESGPAGQSLSTKVRAQRISTADDRLFQMEQIGNDLGLTLFLTRLEENVGRITYQEIVDLWGPPRDLQYQGYTVTAVWRWRRQENLDHGEMITLTFERSRSLLIGWQYGKW